MAAVAKYTPPKEKDRYTREPPSDAEKTKKNLETYLAIGLTAGAIIAGGVGAYHYYNENFQPMYKEYTEAKKEKKDALQNTQAGQLHEIATNVKYEKNRYFQNNPPPQPVVKRSTTGLYTTAELLERSDDDIKVDRGYYGFNERDTEDKLTRNIALAKSYTEIVQKRLPAVPSDAATSKTTYYPGFFNTDDTTSGMDQYKVGGKRPASASFEEGGRYKPYS